MSKPTDLPSVLAVDDDGCYLRLLERMVSKGGARVWCLTSGEQAIAWAETHRPDLILLSIDMPGPDGLETCRGLKANPLTSEIPVLFLTAQGREERHLAAAYSAGGCGYVTKPVSRGQLLAKVQAIFQWRLEATHAQQLRIYDELTRLPDHHYLRLRTDEELSEGARYGTPVTVAMADLDQFSRLNDEHGAEAGDFVLKRFATLLRSEIRRHDIAARWKSARFTLLLSRTPTDGGVDVAQRLCRLWKLVRVPWAGVELTTTASFGVATHWPLQPTTSAGHLLEQAEAALTRAKASGGGHVVAAAPDLPPTTGAATADSVPSDASAAPA
jgi:diguanylate cyclase (GGDEF)-like protein